MSVVFDSHGVSAGSVLAALEEILASPSFEASERNKRFLKFVVTEALAGRADHIKAYTIATVVFGRDSSFDPQTDPIIRIEASRLRRALEHYYLTAGKDAAVRIEIPKGSYVPVVNTHEEALAEPVPSALLPSGPAAPEATPQAPRPASAPASVPLPTAPVSTAPVSTMPVPGWLLSNPWRIATLGIAAIALIGIVVGQVVWSPVAEKAAPAPSKRGPSVLVMPFEDEGSTNAHGAIARGFTREVTVSLTQFKDLFVYADQTSFRLADAPAGAPAIGPLDVDYLLSGAVAMAEGQFRGTVSLVDAKTRRHLWSDRFESPVTPANIFSIREEIAARVTQALAQPYGVIFSNKVKALAAKPPKELVSYECIVQFYSYQRNLAAPLYDDVRRCLERTVAAEPDYAQALSSLAMIYVDAHRFAFARGKLDFPPLPRAKEMAQRAIDLSPEEPQGYKAMHNVLWMMNDVPGSLAMGERAVALNPYDTEAIGDLGARRFYSGNWEGGLSLIRETFRRNPAAHAGYRIPLVLQAYFEGRYEDALGEARRIELPHFIYTHVLVAMSAAASGRDQDSAEALRRVLAIDPAFSRNAVADLRSRNQHPRIIRAVADGLSRAGLPIQGASEISQAAP